LKLPDGYKPVKFGVAGCGGITPTVLRAVEGAAELNVVALMDVDHDAVERIGDEFGIERRHTDFSKLIEDDIEAVIINSPNDCHSSQAAAAFAAGKHCIVQKPLARNVAEAEPMTRTAAENGLLLGVAMIERMDPIYRQMRDMVQAGCFGTVTAVRCFTSHLNHISRPPKPGTWRTSPERIGGGSFIQLAIHHLDLAQWMLDRRIVEVTALSSSFILTDMFPKDETSGAVVKFDGGAVGEFFSSFTSVGDEVEFRGTGGMIRRDEEKIRWRSSRLYRGELWDAGRVDELHDLYIPELANKKAILSENYEPHRRFALAVRGLAVLEVPGEVGVQDLKVVEAVSRSVEEKRTILLLG
jgi:predicted dehydrogenase